ncbi:DUF1640-domain-containing protein [Mytilinidion resinicola]|uniref:DUF1640-domain-containing protein n=1 Tax=Mytilinidion resinicola TaxID=574789 RepID=A0A6A6YQ14_9PEZI|nr:DUF1640-domain-containing protein [Mytilinidion resinicola]KAF2810114.1 DUF1640-domain-containing protein [Mytilinidion resinicola]
MATSAIQTASIPRFLLPRLTWASTSVSPAISAGLLQPNRNRSFTTEAIAGTPHASLGSPKATWTRVASINCSTTSKLPSTQRRSEILSTLNTRRTFSSTARQARDHHFDTLKFVQRLKGDGFTEEQAVAMMKVLSDVIEESIQNLTRTMVLREDQERATYTQKVDFAKLRSELLTADSTESSLTRASHERLTNELTKLNSRLRDEIQRTQASVRLDLNLEKGRIREEANVQELKIKETETRIEQETAVLREKLEAVKFSTLQWLMGVCTGTAALMLGVWRLLM